MQLFWSTLLPWHLCRAGRWARSEAFHLATGRAATVDVADVAKSQKFRSRVLRCFFL